MLGGVVVKETVFQKEEIKPKEVGEAYEDVAVLDLPKE